MHCINPTKLGIAPHPSELSISEQKRLIEPADTARKATKLIAISALSLAAVTIITGCKSRPMPSEAPPPVVTAAPPPVAATPRAPLATNWAEYRRRAAQTIISANPGASFVGPQPAQWQGIATVSVMLNADGSVRALDLMRASKVAPHVNQMALEAARRAANYGPVSNLPQPWQFNETFLYNDDNKFQLITIVEGR